MLDTHAPGFSLLVLLAPGGDIWVHRLDSLERLSQRGMGVQRCKLRWRLRGAALVDHDKESGEELSPTAADLVTNSLSQ